MKRVTGLTDVLGGVVDAFKQFADALRGYDIRRSVWVPRGTIVYVDEPRRAHIMHPLDAIGVENPGEFDIQLDEIAQFFTERAHLELDQILGHIDNTIRWANLRQEQRLAHWLVANDMTEYDLRAAQMRIRWAEGARV